MTKQAQELRKFFNIEKIKNVKLTRIMNTTQPLYLVILDSRRPTFPISTATVKGALPRNFAYANGRNTPLLPFIDLDRYQGLLSSATYILIDLAGSLRNRSMYTEATSSTKLQELTILDLKSREAMSPLTTIFYDERKGIVGEGNKSVKVIECNVKNVGTDDYVEWTFLTESTSRDKTAKVSQTVPSKNFALKNNPSKLYEMTLRIPNFFAWLDTRTSTETLSRADLKEVFENVDVEIFCNCASLHWQGINYNLSQLDASIYPTNIASRPGKGNWKDTQDNGLSCKHLGQLFRYIVFFEQPMLSMLNKKLKDKKII